MCRSDEEKQNEKIKIFAEMVWDTQAVLDLDTQTFLNSLLNIVAHSLPFNDEEYLRDTTREIYKLFVFIHKDKERYSREYL